MVEIGAGGGSIARVNHLGVVQVGPDSAGSSPGPASYGLGGTEPTVTDAHAVLGSIDPARFAVGKVRLDPALGRRALETGLGGGPGEGTGEVAAEVAGVAGDAAGTLAAEPAAQAVIEVVTESMANAARVHASELGKVAEDCTLIAFGGAAPLHAAQLARKLGITTLVIPASAGVGSALGFLWAPVAYQTVRSLHQQLNRIDLGQVQQLLDELAAHADAVVTRAAPGLPLARQQTVFMRYAGQGHEIAVDLPTGPFDADAVAGLRQRFERRYTELYGRALPHIAVEAVSWSVAVTAQTATQRPPDSVDPVGQPARATRQREVYDADQARWLALPVHERAGLQAGDWLRGPALVVEDETTTWLPAGFELRVSEQGALVLQDLAATTTTTTTANETTTTANEAAADETAARSRERAPAAGLEVGR